MPGPGEYRPDPFQGITRVEDLPKPKIRCQSRNYRRRPCPRCGQSAYRDRRVPSQWGQTEFQVNLKLGLTSRQESSGKGDSWKLETFQMEPCG